MMDERSFAALLDARGSNLDAWPATEAREAAFLLERSAAARTELDRARRLDTLLASIAETPTPRVRVGIEAALTARIRDRDPWERLADWFTIAIWRPAAVAALPLALGFVAGLQAPPETDAALMRALSELPLATSFEEPTDDA